jgi:hypothetical protein
MGFLTDSIREHFQNMQPGEIINIWKAKKPLIILWAGKEYIDEGARDIEFNKDYSEIKKLQPWPNFQP